MVGLGGNINDAGYAEAMTIAAISNSSKFLPPELQNFMDAIVGQTFSHHERAQVAEQLHYNEVGNLQQEYYQEQAQQQPSAAQLEQNWENAMAQVAELVNMGDLSFDNITIASEHAAATTAKQQENDRGIV